MSDFHHFYNRVDIAKTRFLVNTTKNGYPTVVEVNYNAVECENDQPSVKNEPMDLEYVNVKPQKQPEKPIETLKRKVSVSSVPNITGKSQLMISRRARPIKTHTPSISSSAQFVPAMRIMSCFYCGHRFRSLDELVEHHASEHSEYDPIRVKCCDKKLEMHQIMDHIEYHRNPDNFK